MHVNHTNHLDVPAVSVRILNLSKVSGKIQIKPSYFNIFL